MADDQPVTNHDSMIDAENQRRRHDPRRELLQQQLGIAWSFAEQFVIPRIEHDPDLCRWEPSPTVVTVREHDGAWHADWPDEDRLPLPEATIGWLLWHIEWWSTNAAYAVRGERTLAPANYSWSGSIEGIVKAKRTWDDLVAGTDLDTLVSGLMPEPRSFAFVAAWANFELTKNLAEINQLLVRAVNAS